MTWRHSTGQSFLAHVSRVRRSRKQECATDKLEAAIEATASDYNQGRPHLRQIKPPLATPEVAANSDR